MKITIPMKTIISPDSYGNLIEFYDAVATEMGYTDTSDLHYDCRKVNIAKNIQDGFYEYYNSLDDSEKEEFESLLEPQQKAFIHERMGKV